MSAKSSLASRWSARDAILWYGPGEDHEDHHARIAAIAHVDLCGRHLGHHEQERILYLGTGALAGWNQMTNTGGWPVGEKYLTGGSTFHVLPGIKADIFSVCQTAAGTPQLCEVQRDNGLTNFTWYFPF